MKHINLSVMSLALSFTSLAVFANDPHAGHAPEKKEEKVAHAPATGHHGVHWGYSGAVSAENWGDLAPDYKTCKEGKEQSPVDVKDTKGGNLKPIQFFYDEVPLRVLHNGHTVQVNVLPGSSMMIDGETYNLLQFHFHTPSENLIKGKSYPLEVHFVHKNAQGQLAVIGVMFENGRENKALKTIWDNMPMKESAEKSIKNSNIQPYDLMPQNKEYYSFKGSLTTPPCSEGVKWILMKDSVQVSPTQVEKFIDALDERKNNRPVQPINLRTIEQ